MIVIFFNLYLKREGSSDFHFEDCISFSCYTQSCTSFNVTFRDCQPLGLKNERSGNKFKTCQIVKILCCVVAT